MKIPLSSSTQFIRTPRCALLRNASKWWKDIIRTKMKVSRKNSPVVSSLCRIQNAWRCQTNHPPNSPAVPTTPRTNHF